jgi:hypothetical protein
MKELIPVDKIESKIYYLRGQKIMIDRDLAQLYGVTTGRLNEQVKRNKERFPKDFMFQLTKIEAEILISQNIISSSLRSQIATLKKGRGQHLKYLPYVFTEQGVAMLSSVLKSKRAIDINIAIMRTFVNIRKFVSSYDGLARQIAEMEKKYDKKISTIMGAIDSLLRDDKKIGKNEIGFRAV